MYILAEFNKKQYFIAACHCNEMAIQLYNLYRSFFPKIKFTIKEDLSLGEYNKLLLQVSFINDFRNLNYLSAQIEHIPLDNP